MFKRKALDARGVSYQKWYDTDNSMLLDNQGTFTTWRTLNDMAVGTTHIDRVGRAVKMNRLLLRGYLTLTGSGADVTKVLQARVTRIMVVLDTQCNVASTPQTTFLFKDETTGGVVQDALSGQDDDYRARFVILYDKITRTPGGSFDWTAANGNVIPSSGRQPFPQWPVDNSVITADIDLHGIDALYGPSIVGNNPPATNNLALVAFADNATPTGNYISWSFECRTRLIFEDNIFSSLSMRESTWPLKVVPIQGGSNPTKPLQMHEPPETAIERAMREFKENMEGKGIMGMYAHNTVGSAKYVVGGTQYGVFGSPINWFTKDLPFILANVRKGHSGWALKPSTPRYAGWDAPAWANLFLPAAMQVFMYLFNVHTNRPYSVVHHGTPTVPPPQLVHVGWPEVVHHDIVQPDNIIGPPKPDLFKESWELADDMTYEDLEDILEAAAEGDEAAKQLAQMVSDMYFTRHPEERVNRDNRQFNQFLSGGTAGTMLAGVISLLYTLYKKYGGMGGNIGLEPGTY